MEIERIDIYDFGVTLSAGEFQVLRILSDDLRLSLEDVFSRMCSMGYTDFITEHNKKE